MSVLTDAKLILTPNAYKASKLYSLKPFDGSGDFGVVRATTAWRRNAAGLWESVANNVPRLHYPVGGGCPSVLVEPQRTNLLLRSQEFDDAYWAKINSSVTPNSITSPDGTVNADKLIDTTNTSVHQIDTTITLSTGNYSVSVYAKKSELEQFSFTTTGGGMSTQVTLFDVNLGTKLSGNGTILNEGNGWYRCTQNFNVLTAGSVVVSIRLYKSGGATFTGTGTDGVFIWQAQLEQATEASSIIPTTSAAVTRNTDLIRKTSITTFLNGLEGTFAVNIKAFSNSGTNRFISISDGTANNRIVIRHSTSNKIEFQVRIGGIFIITLTDAVTNILESNEVVIKYKSGNSALKVNGVEKATSTASFSTTPTTFDTIGFDDGTSGGNFFQGELKSLLYFDNAEAYDNF
jgi:hypothetical protein